MIFVFVFVVAYFIGIVLGRSLGNQCYPKHNC